MEYFLLGITPPGSFAREIHRVHDALLQKWGCDSAGALPVMIPLICCEVLRTEEFLEIMSKANPGRAFPLTLSEYTCIGSSLFIGFHEVEGWNRLVDFLDSIGFGGGHSLIPAAPGFYLSDTAGLPSIDTLRGSLQFPRETRLRRYDISLIQIETSDDTEHWWDEVYSRVVCSVKMRSAG